MKKRIFSLLLCLLMLFSSACAQDTAQQLARSILDYHVQSSGAESMQDWISTTVPDSAGLGAEWYVLGLSQSGSYDFTAYQGKLRAYLAENTVFSATTRQRYALALLASGAGTQDAYITQVMEDSIGQQGIMSWVFGLHLLTNGCESSVATVDSALESILSLQLEDGGWALNGTISDVDVTAMTLQALSPYMDQPSVAAAAEQALTLLSSCQQPDGGYASYGVANPESAAQVLTALSALGIDAATDERFIKDGSTILDALAAYQLADGSFSHTLGGAFSASATYQTFYALVAYQRFLNGQPSLYQLDHAEAEAVPAKTELSWRGIALISIGAAAALSCLVLLLLRKRHWKNFAAVLVIAVAAVAFVLTTDFQTADSYYTGFTTVKEDPTGKVTMTIRCDTVAGKTNASYIPADGVILPETSFAIVQGDTVYTILTEAAQAYSISIENAGAQGMAYIIGVNHLYASAFGDLSGWMYLVNGESPSVGCDQYTLQDGDRIEWLYTCELGNDLN